MKDNGSFTNQAIYSRGIYAAYAILRQDHPGLSGAGLSTWTYVSAQTSQLLFRARTIDDGLRRLRSRLLTANDLLPAFHAAGLSTKALARLTELEQLCSYGAPGVNDATVRNDSLFVAWPGTATTRVARPSRPRAQPISSS